MFARLLAGSVTLSFFTYAFVNMGMVSGILPVVGVPLPFVSYGGTAMVTLGLGLGMLMSVAKSRRLMQSCPNARYAACPWPRRLSLTRQRRIGVVGIGNMGLGMALRLLERGHTVGVRDLDAGARARRQAAWRHGACATPRRWPAAASC